MTTSTINTKNIQVAGPAGAGIASALGVVLHGEDLASDGADVLVLDAVGVDDHTVGVPGEVRGLEGLLTEDTVAATKKKIN